MDLNGSLVLVEGRWETLAKPPYHQSRPPIGRKLTLEVDHKPLPDICARFRLTKHDSICRVRNGQERGERTQRRQVLEASRIHRCIRWTAHRCRPSRDSFRLAQVRVDRTRGGFFQLRPWLQLAGVSSYCPFNFGSQPSP